MKYNPEIHRRRSIRLPGYDYSQSGAYFVTVCTHDRMNLFGKIVGAGSKPAPVVMRINEYGKIVNDTWRDLVNHIAFIQLGEFIIMPNHVHWIIWIMEQQCRAGLEPAPTGKRTPLPEIVRQFKTFSARRINKIRGTSEQPVWQRNYCEHVVCDEEDYRRIAE
ncbi:MAG: transposase [Anaerolineaceae bacterium]